MAWKEARNLPTGKPEAAARLMAATARLSERVRKPVYHLSISFDRTDAVDRETMRRVADRTIRDLGLQEHQVVIVAHRDRAHPHLHLVVNRVHPERGTAWSNSWDYARIERSLRAQEAEMGLRVVPGRHAPVPEAARERGRANAREARRDPAFREHVRRAVGSHLAAARSWDELEGSLAAHGLSIEFRGGGLVVTDGARRVKASEVDRAASRARLERRLGPLGEHRARQEAARREREERAARVERERAQAHEAEGQASGPAAEPANPVERVVRPSPPSVAISPAPSPAALSPDKPEEPAAAPPVRPVEPVAWPPLSPVRPVEPVSPPPIRPVEPAAAPPVRPVEPAARPPLSPVRPVEPVPPQPVRPVEPAARPPLSPVRPAEPVPPPPVRRVEPAARPPRAPAEPPPGRHREPTEGDRYRPALRAFHAELRRIYRHPRQARHAFDAEVLRIGPHRAARTLAETPEAFGDLRYYATPESVARAAGAAERYAPFQAERPRVAARAVADLYRSAQWVEEARRAGRAVEDARLRHDELRERVRRAEAARDTFARLRDVYADPAAALRRIHDVRQRRGSRAVEQTLRERPEQFGALLRSPAGILGALGFHRDAEPARERARVLAAPVRAALDDRQARPGDAALARAAEEVRTAEAAHAAARRRVGPGSGPDAFVLTDRAADLLRSLAWRHAPAWMDRFARQLRPMLPPGAREHARDALEPEPPRRARERDRGRGLDF